MLQLQVTVNPLHVDQCPANGYQSEMKGGAQQAARAFAHIYQMRRHVVTVLCVWHQQQIKSVCGGGAQSQCACSTATTGWSLLAACVWGEVKAIMLKAVQASLPLAVEIKLPVKTNTKGPISIEPQVGRTDVATCVNLPCTDLHNLYKPTACCKQTAYPC